MNYPPVEINPSIGPGAAPNELFYSPPQLQQLLLPGQR
jgi:phospholipid/cholesterol/gamma-HCH transport system substrate-binding protein